MSWICYNYFHIIKIGNLLSFSYDQKVKLWQIETVQLLKSIKFTFTDTDTVYCVKILNENLIAVGSDNGLIQIYNFNNKEIIITIPAHKSPVDELLLLKNGCLLSKSDDGEVKLWKILDDN